MGTDEKLRIPVDNPSFFLPLSKGRGRVGLLSAGMTAKEAQRTFNRSLSDTKYEKTL